MGSGQPPFFYHILINPSSPHLPLPTSFVKRHLRNRILKDPILRTANGGYSWKLKMKKFDDNDDDGFCFVNGWSKVVKDVGLLFGEFLLFKYVGSGVFLMHVYSVNGCEKILVPRSSDFKVDVEVSVEEDEVVFEDDDDVEDEVEEDNDDDDDMEFGVEEHYAEEDEEDDGDVELGDDGDDDDGEDEDYVDIDGDDGDPYFVITSSKRNKDKLRFPPDLVAWATINTKETITLKNDDGYEKEMPVRSYKQNKSTRYYVAEGWKEFQRSNDISEGDECVLKFIKSEDKLCLAKVTKKKPRVTEVDNDDMDNDDGMDEEGEAEYAKDDDYNVDGDDIFDDDVDEEGKGEDANFVADDDEDDDVDANGDEGKGESAKLVNDGEDDEDDDHDDGNLSFILTSANKNQYKLWFSPDFAALAGINTKKTITLKNLDGYEKELRVKSQRRKHGKKYFLSPGWKEFQQKSNISAGDKFVFKFITSEDKFCLAKITKNKTRARPLPVAVEAPVTEVDDGMDDQDVDDNDGDGMDEEGKGEDAKFVVDDDEDDDADVNGDEGKGETAKLVNDDMDDEDDTDEDAKDGDSNVEGDDIFDDDVDEEGEGEDDELVENDGDPSFTATSIKTNQFKLCFSPDFVELAGINTKKTITLKNLGGYEKELRVKSQKRKYGKKYFLSPGWKEFKQDSNISEGDKFVFKFITREDKFCLAKINDHDDEDMADDKDENEDVQPVDGRDPFFVVNITKSHNFMLWLPQDFVELAGIDGKKNIIIKRPDGNERQMVLRPVKQLHSTRYTLSKGWRAFMRSNNILEGDECVFTYITSEDKMCVAKVSKEKTPPTEVDDNDLKVDDGMDGKDVVVDDNKDEDENLELVDDGMDGKDVDEYIKLVDGMDDNKDENEDAEHVDDEDPFFRVTITSSHNSMLRLPPDFVGLAGINTKKDIIIKSPDGNESQMALRSDKRFNSAQYHLAGGWVAFKQRNNLSQGDECVFKYITSEDKLSLAKITKTWVTEADADPFFVVTISPCHRSNLWLPADFVGLTGIDTKENIIVKSLDGNETQIALRSNLCKKKQLTRYCFSIGWGPFKRSNNISEGDDCEFKYITNEDKMCLAKVTKEKTQTMLPSPAEVVKRKRGRLPLAAKIKMTVAENVKMRSRRSPPVEITVAESVKRKRGLPPPSSPLVTKDVKRKKGQR